LLDKQLVFDILTAAMETGGDMAEIFAENTERDTVSMVNGLVEKANWGIESGVGVRIIHGTNAVYAYTNRMDRPSLIKLAKEAAQAIKAGKQNAVIDRFEPLIFKDIHPYVKLPAGVDKRPVAERLREASQASYAYDPLITQTNNSYLGVVQDVLIANTKGLWAEDRRVRTRLMLEAVATSETEKQSAHLGPGARRGYEFVEGLDVRALGREAAETAVTMLKADLCPSGRMPVLIDNGFGGVIFHEACGHGREATSVAKKASVFADKLGQMIASPVVTAIDDGTQPNDWGSLNIDDEGAFTQKNILIENGVLKSYLVDYLNGLKMEMPSTGSGRRESYKFAPTSRMTNTYIANGKEKKEAIIADTEYGLYCKQMGGGSVQPSTGEFNFAVLEGYMVRGGKIAEPVRGATLIGKGSEVLLDIDRVADNMTQAQGMCGSFSGSIPTNVGQPLIRVKQMTVGGRK
jgi:TldD protein